MASIQDDRGYNQGFKETAALTIRTDRRSERMIANMNLGPDSKVLEIGCGTGEMSDFLARNTPAQILGVDLCEAFIDEARTKYKRENLNYEVLKINPDNLQATSLRNFDCIVGNGILHHLYYQLDQVLPDFRQKLKPGGKLIFWEPNLYNPYVFLIFRFNKFRKLAKLEPDEMAFTGRFIQEKLAAAGFRNIKVEYRDFLLPNTPAPLIRPVIFIGGLLERVAGFRRLAQSLFITAET
jgi:2-polyprenyl-3-methyl-5-hydroxy-6-metoxy-1,4-benzoquinol methylase